MASQEIVNSVKKALDDEYNPKRKFKQSVDLVVNLKDVDMSKPENRIDEEIYLPNGRGEKAKIGVFATGEMALKAKESADMVFKPEEMEELAKDAKNAKGVAEEYDFFIAEAPLMPTVGKTLGRFFGPRGKMPRPIPPNADISAEVEKLRNTVRIRSKDKTTFHCIVGKEDMDADAISENIEAILKVVEGKFERGRMNIKSAYVKSTMGTPVRVI
ncbi:MAG: 50S ribosomal protein L1 [Candidatus Thermoplasmatota archaeon]|nr:50S ribosomal protein L1 [Candidatus Thermoplasmatota archaeon]